MSSWPKSDLEARELEGNVQRAGVHSVGQQDFLQRKGPAHRRSAQRKEQPLRPEGRRPFGCAKASGQAKLRSTKARAMAAARRVCVGILAVGFRSYGWAYGIRVGAAKPWLWCIGGASIPGTSGCPPPDIARVANPLRSRRSLTTPDSSPFDEALREAIARATSAPRYCLFQRIRNVAQALARGSPASSAFTPKSTLDKLPLSTPSVARPPAQSQAHSEATILDAGTPLTTSAA